MRETSSPKHRVQGIAIWILAAAGLLVCTARVASAWFRPALAAATCGPSAPSLAQQWGSRAGLGLFLGGLAFFAVALLFELAPTLAEGPSARAAHALVFLLSIPVVALAGRTTVALLRAGARPPLPLSLLTATSMGVFLLAAWADTAPLRIVPSALIANLKALARSWRGRVALAIVTLALGFVAAFLASEQWQARRAARAAREAFVHWFASQPRMDSPLLRDESAASIVIVKFNDYRCPPCRASLRTLGPLLERYQRSFPGRLRLATMDFPLDSACNPTVTGAFHTAACEAAVAVRLARRSGRDARPLEEWLFDHQRELTSAAVWEAAQRLVSVRFEQADHDVALAEVKEDIRRGMALGVQGTPTFFVDGVKLRDIPTAEELQAVLDAELQRLDRGAAHGH
jgi:protein-disulfide isomerase